MRDLSSFALKVPWRRAVEGPGSPHPPAATVTERCHPLPAAAPPDHKAAAAADSTDDAIAAVFPAGDQLPACCAAALRTHEKRPHAARGKLYSPGTLLQSYIASLHRELATLHEAASRPAHQQGAYPASCTSGAGAADCVASAREAADSLRRQLDVAHVRLERERTVAAELQRAHLKQAASLAQQLGAARAAEVAAHDGILQARAELLREREAAEAQQAAMRQVHAELAEVRQEAAAREAEVQRWQQWAAGLEQAAQAAGSGARQAAALREARAQQQEAQARAALLKRQLGAAQQALEAAEGAQQEARARAAALEQDVAIERARAAELEGAAAEARARAGELGQAVACLQAEVHSGQDSVAQAQADAEGATALASMLQAALASSEAALLAASKEAADLHQAASAAEAGQRQAEARLEAEQWRHAQELASVQHQLAAALLQAQEERARCAEANGALAAAQVAAVQQAEQLRAEAAEALEAQRAEAAEELGAALWQAEQQAEELRMQAAAAAAVMAALQRRLGSQSEELTSARLQLLEEQERASSLSEGGGAGAGTPPEAVEEEQEEEEISEEAQEGAGTAPEQRGGGSSDEPAPGEQACLPAEPAELGLARPGRGKQAASPGGSTGASGLAVKALRPHQLAQKVLVCEAGMLVHSTPSCSGVEQGGSGGRTTDIGGLLQRPDASRAFCASCWSPYHAALFGHPQRPAAAQCRGAAAAGPAISRLNSRHLKTLVYVSDGRVHHTPSCPAVTGDRGRARCGELRSVVNCADAKAQFCTQCWSAHHLALYQAHRNALAAVRLELSTAGSSRQELGVAEMPSSPLETSD